MSKEIMDEYIISFDISFRFIANKCHITQRKYIDSMINDWGITKMRETPAKPDLFTVDDDSDILNDKEKKLFHRGVAHELGCMEPHTDFCIACVI